jgi:uncharacterized membrane protein
LSTLPFTFVNANFVKTVKIQEGFDTINKPPYFILKN